MLLQTFVRFSLQSRQTCGKMAAWRPRTPEPGSCPAMLRERAG